MLAKTIRTESVTPILDFSGELFYAMSNISALVDARWIVGLSFADTTNNTIQTAQKVGSDDAGARSAALTSPPASPQVMDFSSQVLGDRLDSLQFGNEADLYINSKRRTEPWSIEICASPPPRPARRIP